MRKEAKKIERCCMPELQEIFQHCIKIRATTIAIVIVVRAITILGAIQKRSHESLYKTDIKNKAKRLRAITFAIAKLEER